MKTLDFHESTALAGFVNYLAHTKIASYMVVFDTKNPQVGWTASRRAFAKGNVEYIGHGHLTFEDAREACSKVAKDEPLS